MWKKNIYGAEWWTHSFSARPQATMVRNHVEIERPKPPPYPQNNTCLWKNLEKLMGGFLFVIYLLKILMKLSLSPLKNLNPSPPPHLKMELSPSDKNVTLTLTKKKCNFLWQPKNLGVKIKRGKLELKLIM